MPEQMLFLSISGVGVFSINCNGLREPKENGRVRAIGIEGKNEKI